jgi:hypothetical protein
MSRRGKSSKPNVMTGTTFTRLPLPSGVPVLMCFCGDPCKVAKSDKKESYNQRYWICKNYAFNPTPRQIRIGLLVRIFIFYNIFTVIHNHVCFISNSRCVTIEYFTDPSPAFVTLSSGSTLRSKSRVRSIYVE